MSIVLYANIVYYRFFSDFITLPTLSQTQNFGDLGGSVLSLLKPYDILFFVDVFVMFYLLFSKKSQKIRSVLAIKRNGNHCLCISGISP